MAILKVFTRNPAEAKEILRQAFPEAKIEVENGSCLVLESPGRDGGWRGDVAETKVATPSDIVWMA